MLDRLHRGTLNEYADDGEGLHTKILHSHLGRGIPLACSWTGQRQAIREMLLLPCKRMCGSARHCRAQDVAADMCACLSRERGYESEASMEEEAPHLAHRIIWESEVQLVPRALAGSRMQPLIVLV